MGWHPQNPAVLNKTAALPVGSAYVPCHGLQASSACVNIAPEQRAPRGTEFLSCGEAVDPSRALHQTSLGNCMVQVPLPHADQKSQPYSNPSEERQWLPCVSEEPCCAHQGPSHTLYWAWRDSEQKYLSTHFPESRSQLQIVSLCSNNQVNKSK